MKTSFVCLLLMIGWLMVSAQQRTPLFEFSLSSGYQVTDLQWSIAGNLSGQSPNVLSEVKWRKLAGPVINGSLKFRVFRNLFIRGDLYSAGIKRGLVTDSDYGLDNRNGRTYYAELDADEGSLRGGSLQAGYGFFSHRRLSVAVSAGYRQNRENLHLLDHANEIAGEKNLRSVYETQWHGAIAAVNIRYRLLTHLLLTDEVTYGQMQYRAVADWNLIDAFQHPVSFRQKAQGYELQNALSCAYEVKPLLSVFLTATAARSETGNGIDNLYLESGTIQSTRFNGVSKNLKSVRLGLFFRL
jgi:hypothetical protein